MIKEVNKGNGMTQIIDWPEEMEVKRIHIRKRHKVEESPLDDILFLFGLTCFALLLCFGVPILQSSEVVYILLLIGMIVSLMTVAFRSGKKRGR